MKLQPVKTVTMLEFRRNAAGILKRLAKGESLVLSHRGKPAARLEPLTRKKEAVSPNDPALNLGEFAVPGPGGRFTSRDTDRLLYGSK